MDNCDFIFHGETLSSYGFILCDFSGASSGGVIATDSQRSFTQMSMFGGKQLPILYYRYESGLTITLSICKDTSGDMRVTREDSTRIKRWLESPQPEIFKLIGFEYCDVSWEGTFNVEEYRISGELYGFNITFNSTAPWGYKDEFTSKGSVDAGESITIIDPSDEEGYIYPDIRITVLSAGDLSIVNSFDNRNTLITGCEEDEVIYITHFLQLGTNSISHDIYNSFNYRFLRIHNTYNDSENVLTFSLPCEYEITYRPIAKAVFN